MRPLISSIAMNGRLVLLDQYTVQIWDDSTTSGAGLQESARASERRPALGNLDRIAGGSVSASYRCRTARSMTP
jgi:hypothetical protein